MLKSFTYIYDILPLTQQLHSNIGKYTSPMDAMVQGETLSKYMAGSSHTIYKPWSERPFG